MRWERGVSTQLPKLEFDSGPLRLPVKLGELWLDLPLMAVDRILDKPLIRPLPGSDDALLGYCNFEGQALPVWQMSALLKMPAHINVSFYLLTHWGGARVLAVEDVGLPYSALADDASQRSSELLSNLQLDPRSRP